ncbi:MAG: hypothetical protein ACTMI6_08865, partial [Pseudomonas bubulae]
MGTQAGAQFSLLIIQVVGRFGITNTKSFESLGGGLFSDVAGFDYVGFQRTAEDFVEGLSNHQKVTGPSLSLSRTCCLTSASQVSIS